MSSGPTLIPALVYTQANRGCSFICRHLRDMMADEARCMSMIKECEGIYCDFSRQRATQQTLDVSYCF